MLVLHSSSTGLDPRALVPGRDLVMRLDPVHGADAPDGTYVFDHLDGAGRAGADRAAVAALGAWRAALDEPTTAEGICWSFVWELPLYALLNDVVPAALALAAAVRATAPEGLVLADGDERTAAIAHAVAAGAGLAVRRDPGARRDPGLRVARPPAPRLRRLRRSAIAAVTRLGMPSVLRRDGVAFYAYWPLMPLLDRMLEERGRRPAVFLDKRPTGVARSLRTAARGGWVGLPSVADRRWAARRAPALVAATEDRAVPLVHGLALDGALRPGLRALAAARAEEDLAHAVLLRRVLGRRRLRWVVGAYETEPKARLLVLAAREAGVRTLMLAHGAFILPQPIADLDHCDEAAIWSWDVAPAMTHLDRPIHVVGYPLPHDPPPATRVRPARPPRIGVLGQLGAFATCTLDDRITMRSYECALEAVRRRLPDATVVLRPHPAQDRGSAAEVIRRTADLAVQERADGDILAFLRDVDLCIGSASTATLQAALTGTPVVVLNLSGSEWPFPLGGDTSVPVARSQEDLDAVLARWDAQGTLPGREDLVRGLGVGESQAVERLLAVLDAHPTSVARPRKRGYDRSPLTPVPAGTRRRRIADTARRDIFVVRRAARAGVTLRRIPTVEVADVFPGTDAIEVTLSHRRRPRGLPHGEALVLSLITAQLAPATVFEIGTGTGEGTVLIARQAPGARIHTLDLGEGTASLGEQRGDAPIRETTAVGEAFRGTPYAERVTQHLGDSAAFDFGPFLSSVDLVFVDGAHTYEYVASDSRAALRMVRPGGVVLWDDCHLYHAGVSRALLELRAEGVDVARILGTRFAVHRS